MADEKSDCSAAPPTPGTLMYHTSEVPSAQTDMALSLPLPLGVDLVPVLLSPSIGARVSRFHDTSTPAFECGKVHPGAVVAAINGVSTLSMPFAEIIALLRSATSPVSIQLRDVEAPVTPSFLSRERAGERGMPPSYARTAAEALSSASDGIPASRSLALLRRRSRSASASSSVSEPGSPHVPIAVDKGLAIVDEYVAPGVDRFIDAASSLLERGSGWVFRGGDEPPIPMGTLENEIQESAQEQRMSRALEAKLASTRNAIETLQKENASLKVSASQVSSSAMSAQKAAEDELASARDAIQALREENASLKLSSSQVSSSTSSAQ